MSRDRISNAVKALRASVLGLVGWLFLRVWSRTVRVRYVNQEVPDQLRSSGRNFIFAFWHGRQFLLLTNHCTPDIVIPSSESRDGEVQARILRRFGYGVVRGSSKRKGERALLGLVDALRRGKNIALAVDGPRGPLYEVKQGVTYLAGKLDKPIVPVIAAAKRFWTLERIWDKYQLPRPFTRGVIFYGDPIIVHGTSEEELERKRAQLAAAINGLMEQADRYFTGSAQE